MVLEELRSLGLNSTKFFRIILLVSIAGSAIIKSKSIGQQETHRHQSSSYRGNPIAPPPSSRRSCDGENYFDGELEPAMYQSLIVGPGVPKEVVLFEGSSQFYYKADLQIPFFPSRSKSKPIFQA